MGLFSKKDDKKNVNMPSLPELPSLPSEFPEMEESDDSHDVHNLPSFPNSQMGDKFSQETIKNAVSGSENNDPEEDEEMPSPLIPKPSFDKIPKPSLDKIPKPNYMGGIEKDSVRKVTQEKTRETGPVFIRIDKFEEALHVFKDTKDKIEEIDKLLGKTKELKEKEEEELSVWEKEIRDMKAQIEKVDKDIFSKI